MAKNLSDAFMDTLYDYRGTVNDRRMNFLEENFVPRDGTIDDMEFQVLRLLGYTGSLTDMWAEYLGNLGGSIEDKADLLSDSFYADYFGQYTVYVAGTDYRPVMVLDPDESDRYLFDCTYKYWSDDKVPAMVMDPQNDYYAIEAFV